MKYFIMWILILPGLLLGLQEVKVEKGQKGKIIEQVKVVNVRVPVRVFYEGKLVDGLTKSDFTVFENNVKKNINDIKIIKKRMDTPPQYQNKNSRIFILSYNKISDLNNHLDEGLDYIFKELIGEGDEIIFNTSRETMNYILSENRNSILFDIKDRLKKDSLKEKQIENRYFQTIKQLIQTYTTILAGNNFDTSCPEVRFLREYLKIWSEYKIRFLAKSFNDYSNLVQYLGKLDKEKWLLEFYQMQSFPKLKPNSRLMQLINHKLALYDANPDTSNGNAFAHLLRQLLKRYQIEVESFRTDLPSEKISLFNQLGITVHSFFIPTTQKNVSQHTSLRNISSGIETALKEISKNTGGKTFLSSDITESVQKAERVEDIMYVLFYEPDDTDTPGEVSIKLSNPKYRITYNKRISKNFIAPVKNGLNKIEIGNAEFLDRKLSFNVKNIKIDDRDKRGKIGVSVKGILDSTNQTVYKVRKSLTCKRGKDSLSLSLFFKELPTGDYTFTISTTDFTTGEKNSRRIKTSFRN